MSSLSDYFRSQAEWRRAKAEEYPEDTRNAQSAAALESLAEYVQRQDDAPAAGRLMRHLFEGAQLGGEETMRAVSRYGFGYNATSPQHEAFLEELAALCLVDAYDDALDHGANDFSSQELLPHELDAARDGIRLPRRYFERRANSTEQALQEWVEAERIAAA